MDPTLGRGAAGRTIEASLAPGESVFRLGVDIDPRVLECHADLTCGLADPLYDSLTAAFREQLPIVACGLDSEEWSGRVVGFQHDAGGEIRWRLRLVRRGA